MLCWWARSQIKSSSQSCLINGREKRKDLRVMADPGSLAAHMQLLQENYLFVCCRNFSNVILLFLTFFFCLSSIVGLSLADRPGLRKSNRAPSLSLNPLLQQSGGAKLCGSSQAAKLSLTVTPQKWSLHFLRYPSWITKASIHGLLVHPPLSLADSCFSRFVLFLLSCWINQLPAKIPLWMPFFIVFTTDERAGWVVRPRQLDTLAPGGFCSRKNGALPRDAAEWSS